MDILQRNRLRYCMLRLVGHMRRLWLPLNFGPPSHRQAMPMSVVDLAPWRGRNLVGESSSRLLARLWLKEHDVGAFFFLSELESVVEEAVEALLSQALRLYTLDLAPRALGCPRELSARLVRPLSEEGLQWEAFACAIEAAALPGGLHGGEHGLHRRGSRAVLAMRGRDKE